MLDEAKRRTKARKLISVIEHALGRDDLAGLRALDVGCSTGFIAAELAAAGARTSGVDIDEPGVSRARARFGREVDFRVARGDALPFADGSMDVVVLNHIYEHVVDPDAVVADIHRVLAPGGLLYLGAGHKYQLVEPHYKLPLLSWLPQPVADRYMRLMRRGDHYYEQYRSRSGLREMLTPFDVWEYTLPVVADPVSFSGDDQVPTWLSRLPERVLAAVVPLAPTYIFVCFKEPSSPAGPRLRVVPRHL